MRVCQLGLLVVALLFGASLGASQALAADGLPSHATLSAMGLGELRVMSDSEGLAIRGLGFQGASAAGKSWASISGHGAYAGSKNSYDVDGKKSASGHTVSFAALEIKKGGGHDDHGGGGYDSRSNCSEQLQAAVDQDLRDRRWLLGRLHQALIDFDAR